MKFREISQQKNYFRISRISQTNIAKFREKIAQNFAKLCQFGGLDPGHTLNQIGQDLRELNFNFVFREIKQIYYRIHPTSKSRLYCCLLEVQKCVSGGICLFLKCGERRQLSCKKFGLKVFHLSLSYLLNFVLRATSEVLADTETGGLCKPPVS
jgi:hypothetical protein